MIRELDRARRGYLRTEEGGSAERFLPAKVVGQLLVLEYPILQREHAAHLEMADTRQGGFRVVGLNGDDKDVGLAELVWAGRYCDRCGKVLHARDGNAVCLEKGGARPTREEGHILPRTCQICTHDRPQCPCAKNDGVHNYPSVVTCMMTMTSVDSSEVIVSIRPILMANR